MGRRSITDKIFDNASTRRRFSKLGIFYHDLQPEDTIESLCVRYGVSEEELLNANFGMRSTLSCGYKRIIIPLKDANEQPEKDGQVDQGGDEKEPEVEEENRRPHHDQRTR